MIVSESNGHYQLLPALRDEEYQALKADITKRGVMVPIEVDELDRVLDGHNRSAIAIELGIECPKIVRHFDSEADKQEHVLKINLLRRHLGPVSWAEAFKKLCEVRGVQSKPGRPAANDNCATVAQLSAELGVPHRTAYYRLALAEQLADAPDLAAKVDSGEMEAKRALRVKREREPAQRVQEVTELAAIPNCDLRLGDFREVLADIPDGSVSLIFTDPPYPKEYLPLWSDLAALAARILKPGALLITYSGQYHLPTVMHSLAEHLEYVWLGALSTPGAHNQVRQKHIRSGVKPLLFYARAPYQPGPWFEDWYRSEERTKDDHEWQQSIGCAKRFIETLTVPGAVVVDPFLGSGTTAVAACELARSFIGSEVDPIAMAVVRRRLSSDKAGT